MLLYTLKGTPRKQNDTLRPLTATDVAVATVAEWCFDEDEAEADFLLCPGMKLFLGTGPLYAGDNEDEVILCI